MSHRSKACHQHKPSQIPVINIDLLSITIFFSVISDVIDVFNNWREKIDKAVENIRDFLPDLEILRGLLLQHKIALMLVLEYLYVLNITIHMIKHQKVFSNPYKTIRIS